MEGQKNDVEFQFRSAGGTHKNPQSFRYKSLSLHFCSAADLVQWGSDNQMKSLFLKNNLAMFEEELIHCVPDVDEKKGEVRVPWADLDKEVEKFARGADIMQPMVKVMSKKFILLVCQLIIGLGGRGGRWVTWGAELCG